MKITFITYHNWETKRIGGFHKLAEYAAKNGHEVVFLSFSRPYYIRWKHDERLNKDVLNKLVRGVKYELPEGGSIYNTTWPTFAVPGPLRKFLPLKILNFLETCSLQSIKTYYNRYLIDTDVFVYESCSGLHLFKKLKKLAPQAKHVYRPSDPIMIDGCSDYQKQLEEYVLLNADFNFIVNEDGVKLYSKQINDFKSRVKYSILRNGVDVSKFRTKYECPNVLKQNNTALYVGAINVEWPLVVESAKKLPDINFVIVCPAEIPDYAKNEQLSNLTFIPGIKPSEVPMYVTNCDLIIVPNPKNVYKIRPWGITAKYYQAMTARKPIVSYSDTEELKKYGVNVSYDYDSFISNLAIAMNGPREVTYDYDAKDWSMIASTFIEKLKTLID